MSRHTKLADDSLLKSIVFPKDYIDLVNEVIALRGTNMKFSQIVREYVHLSAIKEKLKWQSKSEQC